MICCCVHMEDQAQASHYYTLIGELHDDDLVLATRERINQSFRVVNKVVPDNVAALSSCLFSCHCFSRLPALKDEDSDRTLSCISARLHRNISKTVIIVHIWFANVFVVRGHALSHPTGQNKELTCSRPGRPRNNTQPRQTDTYRTR